MGTAAFNYVPDEMLPHRFVVMYIFRRGVMVRFEVFDPFRERTTSWTQSVRRRGGRRDARPAPDWFPAKFVREARKQAVDIDDENRKKASILLTK